MIHPLFTTEDVLKTLTEVNILMGTSDSTTTGEEAMSNIQAGTLEEGYNHEGVQEKFTLTTSRAPTTASLLVLELAVAVRDVNHIQELVDEFYRYSQLKPGIISISRMERQNTQYSLRK